MLVIAPSIVNEEIFADRSCRNIFFPHTAANYFCLHQNVSKIEASAHEGECFPALQQPDGLIESGEEYDGLRGGSQIGSLYGELCQRHVECEPQASRM